MAPDPLQQAWQAQASQTRVTVDANLLLREVQRSQQAFRAAIYGRDVIEVGIALLLLPLWFYLGVNNSLPWTWYLGVPALVWVAGFILVDRRRHPQKPSEPGDPLLKCAQESLKQVEHQIWLLRNVFWWYLLPPTIAILAFFAHVAWLLSKDWRDALGYSFFSIFLLALYSLVYRLNQRAVRTGLEPRRQELLALLAGLGDETTVKQDAGAGNGEGVRTSWILRHPMAALAMLVTLAIVGPAVAAVVYPAPHYAKLAPFTGVRWEGEKPLVEIDEEWFALVSIDGVAATDIVAFSQRNYRRLWQKDLWRKRFEEDLVEVMSRMGHGPKETVQLVVSPLGSSTTRTIENVPMTEANRWKIYLAASDRQNGERLPAMRSAIPADGADGPLKELITRLRIERNLVGLAAMVTIDGNVEAAAAYGERKKGSGVPLKISDRWHLGGVTKPITATMIARLVESGRMQWSDTIGNRFPEAAIHDDWKPVTLKQLLSHTAGAPTHFPRDVLGKWPPLGPERAQARREAVSGVISRRPEHSPGEKYAYSGVGYTIAGAMAENATGETWEDLVKQEVFEPLKLTGAGFGPPKSPDETLDQPRGHGLYGGRKVAVSDEVDNTPIIGPAGTVHMTLSDLSAFATEHLRGELGTGRLLSAETYKFLHTPEYGLYAVGWMKKEPNAEIPYTSYWHNGTNTMWYALLVFIPEKNMVIAVTSNDGDWEQAEAAAWEVVKASAPLIPRTQSGGFAFDRYSGVRCDPSRSLGFSVSQCLFE